MSGSIEKFIEKLRQFFAQTGLDEKFRETNSQFFTRKEKP